MKIRRPIKVNIKFAKQDKSDSEKDNKPLIDFFRLLLEWHVAEQNEQNDKIRNEKGK